MADSSPSPSPLPFTLPLFPLSPFFYSLHSLNFDPVLIRRVKAPEAACEIAFDTPLQAAALWRVARRSASNFWTMST